MFRKLVAEFLGTFVLVFSGCGSVLFACNTGSSIGYLGVALTFGLSVLTMSYAVGHISGGHFNPAVTIGLAAAGKFRNVAEIVAYIAIQIIGGIAAGACLYLIATGKAEFNITTCFATNGYGDYSPEHFSMYACAVTEIILTAILLIVFCGATDKLASAGMAPLAIGMSYTMICLFALPVTNAAINPARATGVALFQGGWAIEQLWFFWVTPVLGGLIGGICYRIFLRTRS